MRVAVIIVCLLADTSAGPAPQSAASRCSLPKNAGECTEALPINRFYCDRSARQCKPFEFTGCGGNANNFRSLVDCQTICGGRMKRNADVAVTDPSITPANSTMNCGNVNCSNNENLVHFYADLGCKPKFSHDNHCCAVSYDCSSRRQFSDSKCYLDDQEYAVGENVPYEKQPKCNVFCKCKQAENDTSPRLHCETIQCAENFYPLAPDCKPIYKNSDCCSDGEVCALSVPTPRTCVFEGKTYMEGERFSSSEHVCKTCYCKRDTQGNLNIDCEPVQCHLQLNHMNFMRRNCIPVFSKRSCCPVDFICANGTATNMNPVTPTPNTAPTMLNDPALAECEFGVQRFTRGDTLPVSGDCVNCKCLLPPYFTCIKDDACTP